MRLYSEALAEDSLRCPSSIYDTDLLATLALKQHSYPGGAWAYRREAWDVIGGLMDKCICGAADHHMAQALLELRQPGEPRGLSPTYDRYIDNWSMHAKATSNRDRSRAGPRRTLSARKNRRQKISRAPSHTQAQ
jgi:hypothetical protein